MVNEEERGEEEVYALMRRANFPRERMKARLAKEPAEVDAGDKVKVLGLKPREPPATEERAKA